MQGMLEKVLDVLIKNGFSLFAAIFIFLIGRWAAHLLANFVGKLMEQSKIEKTLAVFTRNIVYWVLFVFVCLAALNKVGVETTSLIAILGAAGLAVGLALQGSLSNFASGILIILFRPFKVGDFIAAAGTMGTVEEIQIFNTILNAPDNRREIVPNSKITGDNVTNFSAIEKRRIDLVFSISYGDDMKKAKEALMQVLVNDPRVLKEPAPVVAVSELADSSVNLVCRPWVKPSDYWDVRFSVVEQGKLALEKAGLTIPFPQRDVHVYENK
ncbi:MAG TPA: mechanosensitive ion channel [Candidatus Omnitrophota bacterium]|nr:mechanosensitive ion channel [Candidatus Omnitrophota bacterium]